MSEKLIQLKALLQTANKKAIQSKDFIKVLAQVCIKNKIKCKEFRKLFKEFHPETYDEEKAEELYEKYEDDDTIVDFPELEKLIKKNAEKVEVNPADLHAHRPIHHYVEYLALKKHYEEKEGWSKINNPAFYGKVLHNKDGVTFEKEDSPKTYFENKEFAIEHTDEEGKKKSTWCNFFDTWKKDPSIKTYDRIVFDPTMENKNDLNLFANYCMIGKTPMKPVKLDRVLEHMKSICGYDQPCFDYLLKYFAHTVQKPHIHNDVAVVMYGREGVGKNILLQLLGSVMGDQYYAESSEPRDLFGQFATGMYKKMIFVYDESDKKDTSGFMNRLKTLVTGRKLRVELKGKDKFDVDNYCRLFFPTNNSQPFPITQGARRWFYLKASNKYIDLPDEKRFDYFEQLANHFQDKQVIYSFYKYLMAINLDDFNSNKFPKSEGLKQAIQIPLILRCLHTTILSKKDKSTNAYKASHLLKIVIDYCKENNYSFQCYNPTSLGSELQHYIDFGGLEKKTKNSGVYYIFNFEKLRAYIKQNQFNLDDADDEEDEQNNLEKLQLEIEQIKKLLDKKQQRFLEVCESQMGHDPIDQGVEHKEYAVEQPKKTKSKPQLKDLDDDFIFN